MCPSLESSIRHGCNGCPLQLYSRQCVISFFIGNQICHDITISYDLPCLESYIPNARHCLGLCDYWFTNPGWLSCGCSSDHHRKVPGGRMNVRTVAAEFNWCSISRKTTGRRMTLQQACHKKEVLNSWIIFRPKLYSQSYNPFKRCWDGKTPAFTTIDVVLQVQRPLWQRSCSSEG